MRQILLSGGQALVARVPRPSVAAGHVLVRVRYSLVSTGTETAALRPLSAGTAGTTAGEQVADLSSRAQVYLAKALRDPRKAVSRAKELLSAAVRQRLHQVKLAPPASPVELGEVAWQATGCARLRRNGAGAILDTDDSDSSYQALSSAIEVPEGHALRLNIKGRVERGAVAIGLLNHDQTAWLGTYRFEEGDLEESLHFDPAGSQTVFFVVTNAASRISNRLLLESSSAALVPPDGSGLPLSELGQVGWNVGYSAAGEAVALGEGISDIAVGDAVSCCGAGIANHADYVVAPRNLVCRVPQGCPVDLAATATVGSIALQGIRRAQPQLGEVVAVMGLGLIGMITVQLARASGARVIGIDLDPQRAERAMAAGAHATTTDAAHFQRLVRNATAGQGADQTIITAASKSNVLINLAMEVTRRRGRVVLVGDVGLKPERATFYQKEIDLLMSTSYGPGRYDKDYELRGHDYPFAYVRWTLNRNMQAYLDAIAGGRIDIRPLIDRVATVDQAPELYRDLVDSKSPPLAVLFAYPNDLRPLPDAPDATLVNIRGSRKAPADRINYALVGAGGFGTAMLVPQMEKRKDRFFLKAVVSRDAVRGGNFARSRGVGVIASDIEDVLAREDVHLVVIATRHNEHARQVVRALKAGKHVFVEKPLALTWDELDDVRRAYNAGCGRCALMVGFNRRFSPAIQCLAEALKNRVAPLVIQYRVNAGYLPGDHWTQGPEGGGRNIGEACHMYDTIRFLTGAPVTGIHAASVDPQGTAYFRNDNFIATLQFADGSIATVTYTAMGPKEGIAKERIEVLCDGEGYVIDDFKTLTRCRDGSVLWQGAADKGHQEELSRLGDSIASGGAPPIPVDELFETSALAIHIEDIMMGRIHV
jgi:predicted dehydrogenase/threonine dehydrogenase-like Zn-dependent dehydrogenase